VQLIVQVVTFAIRPTVHIKQKKQGYQGKIGLAGFTESLHLKT
jgi:hypothetical protein